MPTVRLAFFGTGDFACPSLEALAASTQFHVLGVVTQPDRPRGRDLRPQPPPVKQTALALRLPVWQPEKCRDPGFVESLRTLAPDLIVVAAYGQLLSPALLAVPHHGCVNVHGSLLPKYRGAAPIQWAILDDEAETGVTIMQMDAGLDTGPILALAPTRIDPRDNAQTLHDRLARLGADLLLQTIPEYVAGGLQPRPQPASGASHARKITKEDGCLDWRLTARALWNRVRGLHPWPGAYTFLPATPQPRLLKIHGAEPITGPAGSPGEILAADTAGILVACGEGALRLTSVQREGGRRMTASEFLAGHPLERGLTLLTSAPG